uniref:Uncharacterized protein n=1 Tax=Cryptomonas curvata TaxID=233186 RepID=A0A7S0QLM6_9CRYP
MIFSALGALLHGDGLGGDFTDAPQAEGPIKVCQARTLCSVSTPATHPSDNFLNVCTGLGCSAVARPLSEPYSAYTKPGNLTVCSPAGCSTASVKASTTVLTKGGWVVN